MRSVFLLSLLVLAVACSDPADPPNALNLAADEFVYLCLAMGEHDADFVDAYFGPEEWRQRARSDALTLDQIQSAARTLMTALQGVDPGEGAQAKRHASLIKQIDALVARAELISGQSLTFDEESRRLYDAQAPHHDHEHFEAMQKDLDARLPGDGSLVDRYARFQSNFEIPKDKLDEVFRTAIEACREQTLEHMDLPEGESFTVEYVTDKSWSGYNWYQGDYQSLIQVNTDLPIYIDRAIDLACHEGYPGHHVYNMLLERDLAKARGWSEYTIYPLFSPRSLIAEGTANFGIDMAFFGDERTEFEKRVLFPLAGLDASRADEYYEIADLTHKLSYAGNEAARRYLDGEIDEDEAVRWLMDYALMAEERARQRVKFIEKYRSYVINYNLGQDLVRNYVQREAGDDEAARWQIFTRLLAEPTLPSSLTP